jgi:N-acetylmuramoyl-L-alanine amidase
MTARATIPTIILDPGHGMGNRSPGRYDPGTVHGSTNEADVVMTYANAIRAALMSMGGLRVVRTRIDARDPAPIGRRAAIARQYAGRVMLSLHLNNSGTGRASGAECFYRGPQHRQDAANLSAIASAIFQIPDRGPKTEAQSQHKRLAVMDFQPTFLLELGFLDHPTDRERLLSPSHQATLAHALAAYLRSYVIPQPPLRRLA